MALSPSEIANSLRQTRKGKLVYDREGHFNDLFNENRYDSKLVSIHPSCLQLKSTQKLIYDDKSKDNTVRNLKDVIDILDDVESQSPNDLTESQCMTASSIDCQLREYDDQQRKIALKVFEEKRRLHKNYFEGLYRNSSLALHSFNLMKTQEEYLKISRLTNKMRARQSEIENKLGKLKNAHKSRAKESANRLEEASLKDQQEAEHAQKRSLEAQKRIEEFTSNGRKLFMAYQEMANIIKSHENTKLLPDNIRQTVQSVNEIMNQFQKMVKQFHNRVLEQKDVELIQGLAENTKMFLDVIKENIASAKEHAAQNDASIINVSEPSTSNAVAPPNHGSTVKIKANLGNDVETLNRFNNFMKLTTEAAQLRDEIKSDQSLKNYRNDLQKAVNVTVNAISVQSGSHLLDKFLKLSHLLEGHPVNVMNRKVSVLSHPQGKNFCLDLMARKFLNQGEDTVSSNNAAAFPNASVIIGLWKAHPAFGEMFLAHIFAKCTHLVPYRVPRLEGQTDDEYNITLGYDVVDGAMESEEKFLKRISGITRLYAAVMFSPLPRGVSPPHPYGIDNAWIWFTKTVNIEPIPRISAAVLYDMLDVCGHSLQQTYGKQFQKLLTILYREYFPKIQATTPSGSQGPTSRLEMLLQTCVRQGRIAPPQGTLQANFWMT